MGIPRFYGRWVRKAGNVTLSSLPTNKIFSVAIDLPGIMHAAAQETWYYGEAVEDKLNRRKYDERKKEINATPRAELNEEFFHKVTDEIMEIMLFFRPEVTIISIDGRAPMAKIQQQRMRRYRGADNSEFKHNPVFPDRFNPIELSPGTELMEALDRRLKKFIRDIGERVFYSSYLIPGEGEHKIMDIYGSKEFRNEAEKHGGINILYGKDADLILLSLISPLKEIIILRENIYSKYKEYVNIEELKENLGKEGVNHRDFVIMMTFIGNDFLPRQPSLKIFHTRPKKGEGKEQQKLSDSSIDNIIQAYLKIRKDIDEEEIEEGYGIFSNKEGLVWDNIKLFITELSNLEPEMLAESIGYNERMKNPSKILSESIVIEDGEEVFDYDENYYSLWYQNALGLKSLNLSVIDGVLGSEVEMEFSQNDIKQMVKEYMRMFSWVDAYYNGDNVDWSQYYPYHYAPLISDIADALNEYDEEDMDFIDAVIKPDEDFEDYNIPHQLLAIIPPQEFHLVPEELQSLTNFEGGIMDLYPHKVSIDYDGTEQDWEGITLTPFADIYRIIDASKNAMIKVDMERFVEISKYTEYEKTAPKDRAYAARKRDLDRRSGRGRGRGRGSSRGSGRSSPGRGSSRGRGRGSRATPTKSVSARTRKKAM
jgi:5'-3' exoribonuclease 1